jgi:CRP/FNR family transcriptional regulator, cyclic AMP receptor protein
MIRDKANALATKPQTLALSRLFHDMPERARDAVLSSAQPISLAKRAVVFDQGDDGDVVYFVQSGRIEISIVSEAGRKVVLNQIPEGHCFGEISMVDRQKRTASAIAMVPSIVLAVTRANFMKAALDCPQLLVNLVEIMCERLRWVSASVEEYALYAVDLRLARRIISMQKQFATDDGSLTITQNDLADFVGATRESTNKILMQWKSDGLVSLQRGKIQVLDVEALEEIAALDHDG